MNEQLSSFQVENLIENIMKTKREKMITIIYKQVQIINRLLNVDDKKFISQTGL